jgi:hypothetical protein
MGNRSSRWVDDAQTSSTDGVLLKPKAKWQYDVLKLVVDNSPPTPLDNWKFMEALHTTIALCPGLVCVVGEEQGFNGHEIYPVAVAAVKWFEAHRTPYVLERRGSVLVQVDATPCPSGPAPSETTTVV